MPRVAHGVKQADLDRLQALITADPDIQQILAAEKVKLARTRDKGGRNREYQNGIRDLVTYIAEQKGYLPHDKYFVNPNDGQLEPHRGWTGMGTLTKVLTVGAVAAGTLATAGAFGVGPMASLMGSGGSGAGYVGASVSGIDKMIAGMGAGGWAATGAGSGFGSGILTGLKKGAGALSPRDWLDAALFGGQTIADFWAAGKMAGASDRAAEIEAQSAREALALLREQWEQSRADFAPYLSAGQGAISQISSNLAGQSPRPLPPAVEARLGGAGPSQPSTMASFGRAPTLDRSRRDGVWGTNPPDRGTSIERTPIAPVSTTMPVRDPRPGTDWTTTMADFPQRPPWSGSRVMVPPLVMLQAPTGERQAVPETYAAFFEAQGARRVTP